MIRCVSVACRAGQPAATGSALRNVHVIYPNSEEYSIEPGGTAQLGEVSTAMLAIGAVLFGLSALAIGIKWVKASFFG